MQIFDDRPAFDGDGQKDGKGQGSYYPAGVSAIKTRSMLADFNFRLQIAWLGYLEGSESNRRSIAVSVNRTDYDAG
ncbi:hypothetical protein [Nitrosovibrio tenuis]|uniref:hypothetical protein n=1 Tax=Nitrosovibrio tenuis TaxID=1233 RepID=UPI000B83CB4F|nr:hypothetical protein [Nitrosovibrio tenuis]